MFTNPRFHYSGAENGSIAAGSGDGEATSASEATSATLPDDEAAMTMHDSDADVDPYLFVVHDSDSDVEDSELSDRLLSMIATMLQSPPCKQEIIEGPPPLEPLFALQGIALP